jgi:hypothetical protein
VFCACDFDSNSLGGQRALLARAKSGSKGGRGSEVGKLTLRTSQVARGTVEDGVIFGKAGGPAARLVEAALVVSGRLEDWTRKDRRRWSLFRRGRLSVWMITKAVGRLLLAGWLEDGREKKTSPGIRCVVAGGGVGKETVSEPRSRIPAHSRFNSLSLIYSQARP